MLAHKVDGEYLTCYSNLLLTTQKLERWAEARVPLSQEMAATSGLNMTCSQMPRNLFLSHKQKGNHTFAAWAVTVRKDKAEEDPEKKPEGEGETEPPADKDVEVSGGMGQTDQFIEYIVHFAKVIKLYQKENRNCFGEGFSYCWINLEVLKFSLEQYIGFVVRQAFYYHCSLHQVWREAEN